MDLKNSFKVFMNSRINSPYIIVSLGVNCFAKTFLTKYRFKKKKDAGELTLPFDYTFYTDAKYVTEFIENDFKDYFEEIYYVKESNYWGKARKIFFSHEKDFTENDKDKLIKMYSHRIRNFRSVLRSANPLLFFQILTDKENGEDVEKLYQVLKSKVSSPFCLAVVDCDGVVDRELPPEIEVFKAPKPSADYDFYSPECYKSEEGREFEHKICSFVNDVIKNKMHQKVVRYF